MQGQRLSQEMPRTLSFDLDMSKYIDAEKLKAEIERLREINRKALEADHIEAGVFHGRAQTLNYLFEFINSLQQEQLPGIEEHGVPGKDFIPVEWVDACEKYGKWKIVQQEQPELPGIDRAEYYYHKGVYEGISQGRADGLKMLDEFAKSKADPIIVIKQQEQPNVDLVKAARHVYESWMGGTMDDVRRDMVELGKVLDARKEE